MASNLKIAQNTAQTEANALVGGLAALPAYTANNDGTVTLTA